MAGHNENAPATSTDKITETIKVPNDKSTETSDPTILANRIRKTSISMPSNLDEMEDLRIDRQKVSSKNMMFVEKLNRRRYLFRRDSIIFA